MSVAVHGAEAGPSTGAGATMTSKKSGKRRGSTSSTGDDSEESRKRSSKSKESKHREKKHGRSASPTLSESSVATDDTSMYSDSEASVYSEASSSIDIDGARGTTATESDPASRQKVSGPAQSAFKYVRPVIDLPVPPALSHDPRRAAEELIDTLLMRYIPQLGGVLLSHSDITFLRRHAQLDADGAFAVVPMAVTCLLWAPEVGMRLEGQLKLSTPSHISLLVHGIFNASITAAHLPSSLEAPQRKSSESTYDWHELEEDEVDAAQATSKTEKESDEPMEGVEGAAEAAATEEAEAAGNEDPLNADDLGEKSTGYWVNRKTGERLGESSKDGKAGSVTFTVVGMTIANHMLSIHGSLLKRPYSIAAPTHVPTLVKTMPLEAAASETARRVRFNEENQTSEFHPYDDADDSSASDDDEDDDDNVNARILTGRDARAATHIRSTSSSSSKKSSKKRSKMGPRSEGDVTTSGESGSESDASGSASRREKKKRKKD